MNDFKHYPVADLLPHSGDMVWLDSIVACDDNGLTAELTVRGNTLVGDHSAVPAWVGIEYMAQAIGAYAGIKAKLTGESIKLGFLLGTRRYNSSVAEFAVGTRLTVRVDKMLQDEQLGIFDCRISGDNIDVSAKLNVYQPAGRLA